MLSDKDKKSPFLLHVLFHYRCNPRNPVPTRLPTHGKHGHNATSCIGGQIFRSLRMRMLCVRIAPGVQEPPRIDPERFLSMSRFDTRQKLDEDTCAISRSCASIFQGVACVPEWIVVVNDTSISVS